MILKREAAMFKGLSAFSFGLFVISSANAAVTMATSRSGSDDINWGQLNKPDSSKFNTPISIKSYGGIDGSVVVLDSNQALGTANLETEERLFS